MFDAEQLVDIIYIAVNKCIQFLYINVNKITHILIVSLTILKIYWDIYTFLPMDKLQSGFWVLLVSVHTMFKREG